MRLQRDDAKDIDEDQFAELNEIEVNYMDILDNSEHQLARWKKKLW